MKKYMLDTNIYDEILKHDIDIKKLKKAGSFYTTRVQSSELVAIVDEKRRDVLLEIHENISAQKIHLRSGAWFGKLLWDDSEIWNDNIRPQVSEIRGNTKNDNHLYDALIGEIAQEDGITIITEDETFRNRLKKNNIDCMTFSEFRLINKL